jgi:hypothetical protein
MTANLVEARVFRGRCLRRMLLYSRHGHIGVALRGSMREMYATNATDNARLEGSSTRGSSGTTAHGMLFDTVHRHAKTT